MKTIYICSAVLALMLFAIACNSSKTTTENQVSNKVQTATTTAEFIVQTDKDDIKAILAGITDYEIEVLKRIAPNINMWLLSITHSEADAKDVIAELKKHSNILEAQTNKTTQTRP